VVVLMLDASMGLVDQDRILAQRVADEGRACVIALNKWDAVPDKDEKTYLKGKTDLCFAATKAQWSVRCSMVFHSLC
jgi:GTP-binding protein